MKTNWQTKKLSEVCDVFTDGNWIESKDQSSDGIRLIQTGNIGQGYFKDRGEKARYISEKTFKRLNCREIFENDVLVSRLPDPVGRACIIPDTGERMITAVDCSILRFNKDIISSFFNYFSQSNNYLNNVESMTSGTTRKRISRNNLGIIDIPIPPRSEQHSIVKKLDKVFRVIEKAKENTEKNLKNSKELFESYLQNIFFQQGNDWEQKSLGEVIQKTETINPLNNPEKEFFYIDVSSVNKENFTIENTTLIKGKNAPSRARKLIKTDDVIFATVRPTLRRIAIISEKLDGQICSTGYFVLRTKEVLNNKLLFYFLQTKEFFKQMEKLQKGASYPAVTDRDVRNRVISYPKPLLEQKIIVKKLDELSEKTKKLKEIYKQKLADLEELKKSILKKAFEGNL